MEGKKKQVRFNDQSDLKLLREVVALNPFADKKRWQQVADSVSDGVFVIDARRARERTDLLVGKFKKDTTESLKKSGVDEDYTEKDILMQEVVDLINDAYSQAIRTKERARTDDAAAKDMRKRAMEGMKKDGEGTPKAKKQNVLNFLSTKQEAEMNMRQQELEMKKEELELQRQRFELEREERKAALEIQKKQNEMLMLMINKNK